jgi:uncharacterized membrane protein YecN with MAPEG domain
MPQPRRLARTVPPPASRIARQYARFNGTLRCAIDVAIGRTSITLMLMTNRSVEAREEAARRGRVPVQVYSTVMGSLTLLFALRVVGQAIQFWAPQRSLPAFEDFQGSGLPYWILLPSQLMILALMAHYTRRVQIRSLAPRRRSGFILAWFGSIYMSVAAGRIMIALLIPDATAWFTVWIPAVFHVVLASFVLTLALYHVVEFRPPPGENN